jgi:predicted Zn-dependent protease with MMP-like domain
MAVTSAEFQHLAQRAWDALPETFRDAVGNLVIQVEDWPSRDALASLEIESPLDLLGLYHGVGLPFQSVGDLPRPPGMILLYRAPILAYARASGETLADVVNHVLIHEIGHHFGFSDDDIKVIETEAAGESRRGRPPERR